MTVVIRYAVTGRGPHSSRVLNVAAHQNTTLQINMIPYPVTLNWHWANPRFGLISCCVIGN